MTLTKALLLFAGKRKLRVRRGVMQFKLEQAKALFPRMPEYVFEKAIGQFIPDIGWPFSSVYEPIENTNWHRLISPFNLISFSNLFWEYIPIPIDERLFDENTKIDIGIVIANKDQDILAEIGRDCESCEKPYLSRRICIQIWNY